MPKRLPANGSRSWSTGTAHIAVGQQAWAELHVIFQVKGPPGLVLHPERLDVCRLGELLHTPDATELLLGVLRDGQPRGSPIPAAMVAVGDGCCGRGGWMLLVRVEMVVRHYDW